MLKTNKKIDLNLSDETKSFSQRIDEVRGLVEENLRYTKTLRQPAQKADEVVTQQELQGLLQENLKLSEKLYEMTKSIKRWVIFQEVWGVLKVLLILVPLVLGIIYLPALLKEVIKPYQELLNPGQNTTSQGLIQQLTNKLDNAKTD